VEGAQVVVRRVAGAIEHHAHVAAEQAHVALERRVDVPIQLRQTRPQPAAHEPGRADDGRQPGHGGEPRAPICFAGAPATIAYSATSPRTTEPAATTAPLRITAPSSTTTPAPSQQSSSITMPPLDGWKPCSRISRSRSAMAWLVGASVQLAAIATEWPMRTPLPV